MPAIQHLAHRRHARAEAQVAARVVRHGGAALGESCELGRVDPDGVRSGEARAQQTETVEVCRHRPAVDARSRHRLRLRLGEMHVQAHVVFGGEVAAREEKRVRAVHRYGGPERRTHPVAVEGPSREDASQGLDDRLMGGGAQRLEAGPQRLRHEV